MRTEDKLINWAELSRLLTNDRSSITRSRISKIHQDKVDDLRKHISKWMKKNIEDHE